MTGVRPSEQYVLLSSRRMNDSPRYVRVPHTIIDELVKHDDARLRVYMHLMKWASIKDKACNNSIRRIAVATNSSERTVRRSIQALEADGHIRAERQRGVLTHYFTGDRYWQELPATRKPKAKADAATPERLEYRKTPEQIQAELEAEEEAFAAELAAKRALRPTR